MHANDDFYFLRFEHRPLTPEELEQLKRLAERAATEYRARLLRGLGIAALASLRRAGGGVLGLLRALGYRTAAVASAGWNAYAAWRERRAAINELAALDDRTLRDLGLTRSEIEYVVRRDSARSCERQAPVRQGAARAGTAANRRPAPSIEKRAA